MTRGQVFEDGIDKINHPGLSRVVQGQVSQEPGDLIVEFVLLAGGGREAVKLLWDMQPGRPESPEERVVAPFVDVEVAQHHQVAFLSVIYAAALPQFLGDILGEFLQFGNALFWLAIADMCGQQRQSDIARPEAHDIGRAVKLIDRLTQFFGIILFTRRQHDLARQPGGGDPALVIEVGKTLVVAAMPGIHIAEHDSPIWSQEIVHKSADAYRIGHDLLDGDHIEAADDFGDAGQGMQVAFGTVWIGVKGGVNLTKPENVPACHQQIAINDLLGYRYLRLFGFIDSAPEPDYILDNMFWEIHIAVHNQPDSLITELLLEITVAYIIGIVTLFDGQSEFITPDFHFARPVCSNRFPCGIVQLRIVIPGRREMNSALIETAIGLVLTFSLLSVAVSWVTEYVHRFLKTKQNRSIFLLDQLEKMFAGSDSNFVKNVLSHPLVKVLDSDGEATGATYVGAEDLTRSILNYADEVTNLPNELQVLLTSASKAADAAKERIVLVNAWVDKQYSNMSALFKTNQYWWSFFIGLLVAILLNIDTLQMAQVFWKDPTLRATVVETARDIPIQESPGGDTDDETVETARDQSLSAINTLLDSNLPIGWWTEAPAVYTGDSEEVSLSVFEQGKDPRVVGDVFSSLEMLVLKAIGLLLTAWAVSRGSDFWFNLLRKLTN